MKVGETLLIGSHVLCLSLLNFKEKFKKKSFRSCQAKSPVQKWLGLAFCRLSGEVVLLSMLSQPIHMRYPKCFYRLETHAAASAGGLCTA